MRETSPYSRSVNLRCAILVAVAITFGCLLSSCGSRLGNDLQSGFSLGEGEADYKFGKLEEAEAEFKESIKFLGDNQNLWMDKAEALVRLGQIYSKRGKVNEAETYLDQALALFEKNPESSILKSDRLKVRKYWIEALRCRAALYRNTPAQASQADALEAKATQLESKK
jgi:tetratricopeptide (TPR) repeat protein